MECLQQWATVLVKLMEKDDLVCFLTISLFRPSRSAQRHTKAVNCKFVNGND